MENFESIHDLIFLSKELAGVSFKIHWYIFINYTSRC